ncbi:MAG TPA: biotin--[acetyl-CoA-carboxylase] ligase [Flavitalea sp.]|nr:biotin--[acetyl-CoA-carboxylase] ligase [Flavitalea sp.]
MGVLIFKNSNLFPQTFANHTPIRPFIILSITESTNNYAMAKLHAGMVKHPTCFFAIEQTHGRGQRGKTWIANPGDNITMSSVFTLSGSISSHIFTFPFLLSAAMALGCYDFIKDCSIPDVSIKWPNDIYSGDRKAAGILIENLYRGRNWHQTVVGTGININQTSFPDHLTKAVSFKMLTGEHYDTLKHGKTLFAFLINRFERLKTVSTESIMTEYNSLLYCRGSEVKLKKQNISFIAKISHITPFGELVTIGATEQSFKVGEVEFI